MYHGFGDVTEQGKAYCDQVNGTYDDSGNCTVMGVTFDPDAFPSGVPPIPGLPPMPATPGGTPTTTTPPVPPTPPVPTVQPPAQPPPAQAKSGTPDWLLPAVIGVSAIAVVAVLAK